MKLLIIDDNVALSWRLRSYLGKHYDIQVANTGTEGQHLAESGRYEVIILDLGLPDIRGDKVCQNLRAEGVVTPILVLTGEMTLESKVKLFEAGADDYLTKPFQPAELNARIKALIRRRQLGPPTLLLQVGDLTIDPEQRLVKRKDTSITLRRKEFDILEYLMRNQGKVVTPDMIFNHVWNEMTKEMWSNTVRVHIKHLRDKVDKPFGSHLIRTARGVGYVIDEAHV